MFDAAITDPWPDLRFDPRDQAVALGAGPWRLGAVRGELSTFHVVLHRRHGDWTHAYRVTPGPRPGRFTIHLLRVAEGDRRAEMAAWLLDRLRR
ncbi:MAG: hypothetical protein K2X11_19865 [Acetobacteraceae bacterium]|nr:hypothetical protein [Acetobacteraceae bacterium]